MEENCAFGESCLNLALNQSSHFLSAYPTKIVFGKCCPTGYIMSKFFQFELFELHKLYCAIFDIVKFFALNNALEKQLVVSKLDQNYYVVGKVLCINGEQKRVGVFGIEQLTEGSVVYELFFTDLELNNFIYALIKVIPSSLCLTSQELLLFQKVTKETSKQIILLRGENKSKQYVKTFLKELKQDTSTEVQDVLIYNLCTYLTYYCELFLLLIKLKLFSTLNYDLTT
jgi:hypothetical protein